MERMHFKASFMVFHNAGRIILIGPKAKTDFWTSYGIRGPLQILNLEIAFGIFENGVGGGLLWHHSALNPDYVGTPLFL